MTKKYLIYLLTFLCANSIEAQTVFHTKDITNFYQAFDSLLTTTNKKEQIDIVQQIYLDQASQGLKYAIDNSLDNGKKANAENWVNMMSNAKENFMGDHQIGLAAPEDPALIRGMSCGHGESLALVSRPKSRVRITRNKKIVNPSMGMSYNQ